VSVAHNAAVKLLKELERYKGAGRSLETVNRGFATM
jgi:hypothetical protein